VVADFSALVDGKPEAGVSVARGDYHYILWRDGREALFNVVTDPEEASPIPPSPSSAQVRALLKDLVLRSSEQRHRSNEFNALGYLQ
jgi:hypothetical protein